MCRSIDGSDVSINSSSTVRSDRTCFTTETNCLFTVSFWKNKQSSVDQSVNRGLIPETNQNNQKIEKNQKSKKKRKKISKCRKKIGKKSKNLKKSKNRK